MNAPTTTRPWRAEPTREIWRQQTRDLTDEQCKAFATWMDENGYAPANARQLHALRVTYATSKDPDTWPGAL